MLQLSDGRRYGHTRIYCSIVPVVAVQKSEKSLSITLCVLIFFAAFTHDESFVIWMWKQIVILDELATDATLKSEITGSVSKRHEKIATTSRGLVERQVFAHLQAARCIIPHQNMIKFSMCEWEKSWLNELAKASERWRNDFENLSDAQVSKRRYFSAHWGLQNLYLVINIHRTIFMEAASCCATHFFYFSPVKTRASRN